MDVSYWPKARVESYRAERQLSVQEAAGGAPGPIRQQATHISHLALLDVASLSAIGR